MDWASCDFNLVLSMSRFFLIIPMISFSWSLFFLLSYNGGSSPLLTYNFKSLVRGDFELMDRWPGDGYTFGIWFCW